MPVLCTTLLWDAYDDILNARKAARNWLIAGPATHSLDRQPGMGVQILSGLTSNRQISRPNCLRLRPENGRRGPINDPPLHHRMQFVRHRFG